MKTFTDEFKQWLIEYVDMYRSTKDGAWLYEVDYINMKYAWDMTEYKLNSQPSTWKKKLLNKLFGGIMGKYNIFRNEVSLMYGEAVDSPHATMRKFWIKTLMPTVIHELWHSRQYKQHKLQYLLQCNLITRQSKIEDSADVQTELAEKFFEPLP